MKNNLSRLYLLSFFLLTDFVIFAQTTPGDGTGDGDPLEGGDPPLPINGKLIWLVIAAIVFAFYSYNNKTKKVL